MFYFYLIKQFAGACKGDPKVTDLRCLKYSADGNIYYKLRFEDQYRLLPHQYKEQAHWATKPLFKERLKVSADKWKDLQELAMVLPPDTHVWYKSIPSKETLKVSKKVKKANTFSCGIKFPSITKKGGSRQQLSKAANKTKKIQKKTPAIKPVTRPTNNKKVDQKNVSPKTILEPKKNRKKATVIRPTSNKTIDQKKVSSKTIRQSKNNTIRKSLRKAS